MRILAVSGSLREGSFNTSLLRAAVEAAPEGVELELWEGIGELPLYDEDLEADGVPILEVVDESDQVSFKCADPDGYTVEVYSAESD